MIGGGPAGLFLASRMASLAGARSGSERPEVILLERMAKPGRKLLATGGGACNVTHLGSVDEFLGRYGDKGRFLKKALYAFTNRDLASWLGERGIALEAERGGKLFPASRKAADVLGVLLEECASAGVRIVTGARATAVRRGDGLFAVEALGADGGSASYRAPFLAIAAGGCSYPGTGSSGDGYLLARSLGHSIVPPRPALAPLTLRGSALRGLAGLGFEDLPFAIRRGGKRIGRSRGEVLITHEGLSGPGILDASRGLEPGDVLELDFTGIGMEAFRSDLAARVAAAPRALARSALSEAGLSRRLSELICSLAGQDPGARCAELKREGREAMARYASEFPAEIGGLGGFDKAMATAGGVSLDEVDPGSMESRVEEGLFFAGEVLDYDGDTGGYNLQAAFSTAAAAARAVAARLARLRAASR